MALHQAEKLAVVCGRVAFVGKDPVPFAGSAVPYVIDAALEPAAAFGVAAALAFSPEETNLVLAADVPRCLRPSWRPSSRWPRRSTLPPWFRFRADGRSPCARCGGARPSRPSARGSTRGITLSWPPFTPSTPC